MNRSVSRFLDDLDRKDEERRLEVNKMKNRKQEICVRCGKERPIDPVKHLCHECWQDDKDAEREE